MHTNPHRKLPKGTKGIKGQRGTEGEREGKINRSLI